jgi:hypothetical protein
MCWLFSLHQQWMVIARFLFIESNVDRLSLSSVSLFGLSGYCIKVVGVNLIWVTFKKLSNMDSFCVTLKSCQLGFDLCYTQKLSVWIRFVLLFKSCSCLHGFSCGCHLARGWNSVSLCKGFCFRFCTEVIDFCWLVALLAIHWCR